MTIDLCKVPTQLDRKNTVYLLDQNMMNQKSKKFPMAKNFVTVQDVLNKYADDLSILRVAKAEGMVVVTRDKKMTLYGLLRRQDMVFVDGEKRWHHMSGLKIQVIMRGF